MNHQDEPGLAKLIGHKVRVNLMPALGVSDYMPDTRLFGFDPVSIEVDGRFSAREFIPMLRVISIHHASSCHDSSGNTCPWPRN